jgi:hypothetical protein
MAARHTLAACIALIILFTATAAASPGNITVSVNINNTASSVRLPGAGDLQAGQSATLSDPSHYYIASYANGILYGLVFVYQTPLYIMTFPFTGGHTIRMGSDDQNSRILFAFTRGSWGVIEERMPLIEVGNFFSYMYPSFSYGLGKDNDVKILLDYSEAYNVDSGLILNPGTHQLSVEHMGQQDGRQVIMIRRA